MVGVCITCSSFICEVPILLVAVEPDMDRATIDLFQLLQLAAHKLQKQADRRISSATNVTSSQVAVLNFLKSNSGAAQKQVAAELGQNESAITAMIGRLRKEGFVERIRSSEDSRAWNLFITSAGKKQLAKSLKAFEPVEAIFTNALTDRQRQHLVVSLNALLMACDEEK